MHMQTTNFTLNEWLHHCEQLHPVGIDMGLDRVAEVARRMQLHFACPVVTVAGTNGKGSTCAMLEAIASEAGYRTGLYTSPHLVHFQERCRIRREAVDEVQLVEHFAAVEAARVAGDAPVSLTYFEFTTLAILRCLSVAQLDFVILEVGLGGRLDATNVVDSACAIITSIDIDHTEYLGPDRESIGREKAGIMRAGCPVIVSDPMPPQSIEDVAATLGADLWKLGRDFNFSGDQQQWAWAGRGRRYVGLGYPALRGANQLINAAGVLAVFEALRAEVPVTAQAIRNGLAMVELPGRFQIIPGQPVLVLDVAHNPHAVAALAANLDAMGFYPKTHAVFGAMSDKDIELIFKKMAPLVDAWYLTDLPTPRAEKSSALADLLRSLPSAPGLPPVVQISTHERPQLALSAAVEAATTADRIIVFGSFYTVGGVLSEGTPRLQAQHLAN